MQTKRRPTRKELNAARALIKDLIEEFVTDPYNTVSSGGRYGIDRIKMKITQFEFDYPEN